MQDKYKGRSMKKSRLVFAVSAVTPGSNSQYTQLLLRLVLVYLDE